MPPARIPDLVRHRGERPAHPGVARGRLGAQQRLGLPRRGPPAVVGPVGGQRTDQRALAALGPQVRVDDQRRVRRRAWPAARAGPRRPRARPWSPPARPRRAAARARTSRRRRWRSRSRGRRTGPWPARTAWSAAGPPRVFDPAHRDVQRGADRHRGDRGQRLAGVLQRGLARAGRPPRCGAAPGGAARAARPRRPRRRSCRPAIAAASAAQRVRGTGRQLGVVAEHGDRVRARAAAARWRTGWRPAAGPSAGPPPRRRGAAADTRASPRARR